MLEVNEAPASLADLEVLVFGNYGHYTSMQVRAGSVRGLDLHLDRVEANSLKLFGRSASRERVLRAIRHALPTSGNCSIRVTVFTHELRRVFAGEAIEPDLMVSASPSLDADQSPLRVLPLISHPGERADALEGPAGTEAMRRVRRTGRLGLHRSAHPSTPTR